MQRMKKGGVLYFLWMGSILMACPFLGAFLSMQSGLSHQSTFEDISLALELLIMLLVVSGMLAIMLIINAENKEFTRKIGEFSYSEDLTTTLANEIDAKWKKLKDRLFICMFLGVLIFLFLAGMARGELLFMRPVSIIAIDALAMTNMLFTTYVFNESLSKYRCLNRCKNL